MTTPTLARGARLGPYEIESLLGAGGMGAVYRAVDRRLSRTVAIKILSGGVPADDRRRERFHDEARAISSISHPHIRALYDVGSSGDIDYLVMEYVEGQTLATHLRGRPLPLDRALAYAIEIAEALSVAHRAGIVHCDIKPANIMVTAAGTRLLDFGVARLWSDLHAPGDGATAPTDTDESRGGTLAFMAPERFDGRPCDVRGDIYSLGVVLYELFGRRRPFESTDRTALITAIRDGEPPSLAAVNPQLGQELDHVVMKCLARDPEQRWQNTADLAGELRWVARRLQLAPSRVRGRSPIAMMSAAAIGVVLAAVTLKFSSTLTLGSEAGASPVRFLLESELGSTIGVNPGSFSVSPDGMHMVFTASVAGGRRVLWLRSLNAYDSQPLQGTDEAWNPFWNLDSHRVGFFAGSHIRSVDIRSGTLMTIGEVPGDTPRGATAAWNADGDIVIAAGGTLLKMSEADGTITVLDVPGIGKKVRYSMPSFFPDGKRLLVNAKGAHGAGGLYVTSVSPVAEARRLLDSDSQGVYADGGFLLYMKGSALMAQRLDPDALERAGPARVLSESVSLFNTFNQGAFSASRGRVLAYRAGVINSQLRWVDRSGRVLSTVTPAGPYLNPSLSPDGTCVAITRFDPAAGSSDIWVIDGRGGATQLTSGPAAEDFATWSPDGVHVLFSTNVNGSNELFQKRWSASADETGTPVVTGAENNMPFQWGTARDVLFFLAAAPGGFLNGRFLARDVHGRPHEVPPTEEQRVAESGQPQISPDGRWIAYVSDVTGSPHVFVRPFNGGAGRWLISPSGGFEPRWRGDGRELFYLAPDRALMSVDVHASAGTFVASDPRPLFRTNLAGSYLGSAFPNSRVRNEYQVAADGQRFLLNEPVEGASAYAVRVLVNWGTLLDSTVR